MSKNKNNPQISFLREIQKIAPTLLEEKEFEIKSGVVISDSVRKNLEDLDLDRNAELGYGGKRKRETGELETFIIENCPELIQQKQDSLYRLGGEVGKLFGALDTQSEARKKALESLTKDFIKTASYIKMGKKIPEDNFLQMHPVAQMAPATTMEGEEQSGSRKGRSGVVNNSGGRLGYLKVLLGITALASVVKSEAAPHRNNQNLLVDESSKFGVNKNVPHYAREAVEQGPENDHYPDSLPISKITLARNSVISVEQIISIEQSTQATMNKKFTGRLDVGAMDEGSILIPALNQELLINYDNYIREVKDLTATIKKEPVDDLSFMDGLILSTKNHGVTFVSGDGKLMRKKYSVIHASVDCVKAAIESIIEDVTNSSEQNKYKEALIKLKKAKKVLNKASDLKGSAFDIKIPDRTDTYRSHIAKLKSSLKKLSRENGQQKKKESLNPKPNKKKEEIKDDPDHKGESLEKTKPKKNLRTKVKKSKKSLSRSDQELKIVSAAENNQLEKFVSIVESGFDHTQHLITGSTIAHLVVEVDNVKMIEALHAKRGVEVFSIQDKAGTKPLYMAAQRNKLKSAKKLLELGVNATQSTKDGITPAHVAAALGNIKIIEALFEAGGFEAISQKENSGKTPLDNASIAGHKEVEALLSSYTKKHQQQKQEERDSQAPEGQQQKQQKSDNQQNSQSLKEPQKQQELYGQQNSQPLEEEQQNKKKQEGSNQQDSQSSYAVPLAATIVVAVAGYGYMLKGKLKQEKEENAVLRERLAGLQRNLVEQENVANEQKDQLEEGLQGQIDKLKNAISAKDQELAAIAEEKELSDSLAEKLGRQSKVLKKEFDTLKAKQNLNSQEGIPWIPEWVQDRAGNLPVDFDKFVSTIPQDFEAGGVDNDDLKALSSLLKRINIKDLLRIRNMKDNVNVEGSRLTKNENLLLVALKTAVTITVDQANYGLKDNTSSAHLALRHTLISLKDKGKFPNLKEEQEEAAKKANQDLEGKENGETTSKAFEIHPLQAASSAAAKPSSKAKRRGRKKKASRLNEGDEGKEGHNSEGGRG